MKATNKDDYIITCLQLIILVFVFLERFTWTFQQQMLFGIQICVAFCDVLSSEQNLINRKRLIRKRE